ncbi:MAG: prolyl oligopeptidase family serine peptidase [Bacteroidales bacterium]
MKKSLIILSILMLMASCVSKPENKDAIIEKTSIVSNDGVLTPEIMLELGRVSDPQLSPNKSKIIYGITYTDIDQNKSVRQLYTMSVDGKNNQEITHFTKSAYNARWYNDDNILFIQNGQIQLMNPDGSNIRRVSNVQGGVTGFELSPDHKKIIYSHEIKACIHPTDNYKDLPKSTGRTITGLMYRHWDHFVETIPHTYITDIKIFDDFIMDEGVDILDGAPFELPTCPWSGLEQLSWTPDATQIAYSCRKLTGKDYALSTNTDIYLYDVANKTCKNLTEGMMGYDTDPVFSPDGNYLAWISMKRAGYEADQQRLFIMNMKTMEKKDISIKFDYNITNPVWSHDSKSIYFTSLVNALQGLFVTDLYSNITRITKENDWHDYGKVIENNGRLISCMQSMDKPNEIVSVIIEDGSFTRLTHENDNIFAQLKDCTTEQRWLTTVDKKKMHEWVIFPPNFDKTKKYPVIEFFTGGPQGTLSQHWSTRWNFRLMAAQGYIVLLPNRRGTTAFGQDWCEEISGDYYGLNMDDYLTAAKNIKKEKYCGKIGASGASYGGFSIYYMAGHHHGMYDAFLAHAGIFNQEHMYLETEELWFPHWDNGGSPWDKNRIAKKHYEHSAHKFIQNWDTPIMVTAGELDYRVPVDQNMAAFNAAQLMGIPSRMLLFPDENHWILKPQNAIHWQREYFKWFDQWLKPAKTNSDNAIVAEK